MDMPPPPEKPKARVNPLLLDEDELRVAARPSSPPAKENPVAPRDVPAWVQRAVQAAEEKQDAAEEETPTPVRWPMLTGIWTYPFHLSVLAVWVFVSIGLIVTGWLTMFWIEYGTILGMTTARLLGLPPLATGTLTLAYAATCCLTIIEGTSYGGDEFPITPLFDWKGWVWNLFHIAALALEAGVVGFLVHLICGGGSLWPAIVSTLVAFPFVLLGALAADGAWAPIAIRTILRSIVPAGWAWGLFFLQTMPPIVGWILLTRAGLGGPSPWLTPLYAGPLLAAIILIYARLSGRLAGCIGAAIEEPSNEGDDDDDDNE